MRGMGWVLLLKGGREGRESPGRSHPAGRSLAGSHRRWLKALRASGTAASQDAARIAVLLGTATPQSRASGGTRRTKVSPLSASPGSRGQLWWWCSCCHHLQSGTKGRANWLLQGPAVCSKHPWPAWALPWGQCPQISTSLSLSLSWSPS